MISLESFIKGIHQAILAANESLMERNANLLKMFFEPVEPVDGKKGQVGVFRKPKIKSTSEGPVKVRNIFNSKSRPKSIVIQYPKHTPEGIELVDVEVPLITLVPTGLSQIDKVNINMDVVLSLDAKGNVNIGFEKPKKKRRRLFHKPEKSSSKIGNIDITLTPHEGADGLKLLIEKYEKVLRAEIPS